MKISTKYVLSAARRKPLAACCAVIFALAAPEAMATTWPVTNCSDHNPGSLRDVVGNVSVVSGDTVDLSQLHAIAGCSTSTISLYSGQIVVKQSSLTIQGPALIKADYANPDGVFNHQGTGTLAINDMRLTGGINSVSNTSDVKGGCVYSAGNVALSGSTVYGCNVNPYSPGQAAEGAGIFTKGNLTLSNSTIQNNVVADGRGYNTAVYGGGVYVGGALIMKYSTISNNSAIGSHAGVGGVWVSGNVSISNSTISGNTGGSAGGIYLASVTTNHSATITSSTISGNTALSNAGMYSRIPTTINNSTIAFNQNTTSTGHSPGLTFGALIGSITVNLHSTLISNNEVVLSGSSPVNDDLGVANTGTFTVTFATDAQQGNFNLIRALDATVSASSLPPDTIIGKCPLLGPLRNNGGTTQTHALYSGSPAIDTGVSIDEVYDQRGGPQPVITPIPPPPLAYERQSGTRADIGAYEVQISDNIFSAGFEGCP